MECAKGYSTIIDCFLKADSVINRFQNPYCSISGGKDSDIMLDIITKVDVDKKVKYVWFNTGVEYQATKSHLDYLEQRYNIEIVKAKAVKSIPLSCREYGQPFLSKYVSDMIYRLQSHNFQWEDEPFEILINKYPKCRAALSWWTNNRPNTKHGFCQFNISYNKYLKEFMVNNPPDFAISKKCCEYAKKQTAHQHEKENGCDLAIIGVRKAEGGIRSASYKNCFSDEEDKISQYRPLFWFSDADREVYDELFGIQHSDCYQTYGLTRTGCVGCPYNKKLEDEIAAMEQYEPKLAKAAKTVFKDSYEYTRKYREFVQKMKDNQ